MAARLPLIVSQPARRDSTAIDLIENIIAHALLVPRLDANLVGDISSIEDGSTDHLCLQGHGRDVILASFLDLQIAQSSWQRLQLGGSFIDCSLPPAELRLASIAAGNQQRVFYFRLTGQTRIKSFLDQCQELVDAQATQLVTIQFGGLPQVQSQPKPQSSRTANDTNQGFSAGTISYKDTAEDPADDREWSQIDKLVDELDALDL